MNMHFNSFTHVYSDGRKFSETNKKLSRTKILISARDQYFATMFSKIIVGRTKKKWDPKVRIPALFADEGQSAGENAKSLPLDPRSQK